MSKHGNTWQHMATNGNTQENEPAKRILQYTVKITKQGMMGNAPSAIK